MPVKLSCNVPGCDNPKVPGRGRKYCATCLEVATKRSYDRNLQRLRDWSAANADLARAARRRNSRKPENKAKAAESRRRARISDPRTAWSKTLWDRFKITADDYDDMLASQGGGCALCGKPQGANQRRLHVDHDHRCCPTIGKCCGRCIRGILCQGCNQLLGWYERRRDLVNTFADSKMTGETA